MIAGALRALLLATLLLALLLWPRAGSDEARLLHFDADDPAEMLRQAAQGQVLIVRDRDDAPGPAELAALSAAAAAGAALAVALPAAPPNLVVVPLPPLRAGRAGEIGFRVRGPSRGSARVVLSDVAGPIDSTTFRFDAQGGASGAFRVRPDREGWHEWMLTLASTGDSGPADTARTGGWARPAVPPRVLVAAGPPAWETRFLARALEESGAIVSLRQPLGRGLTLGDEPAGSWTAGQLADHDVVIMMQGAHADAAALDALRAFAAAGGGMIAAGNPAASAALGLADGLRSRQADARDSTRFEWALPAAIVQLPPVDFASDVVAFDAPGPAVLVAARHDDAPALLLAAYGRGRTAAVGPLDTWRWRMQAGRIDEHRAFWRSLVDWAATGRDPVTAAADPPISRVGDVVQISLDIAPGTTPGPVTLRRPDGSVETLAPATDTGESVLRFVSADTGVHTVGANEEAIAAARADAIGVRDAAAWSSLARMAAESGGFARAGAELDGAIDEWRRRTGARADRAGTTLLLFLLLVGAALAEWIIRRTRGQA